VELRSLVPPMCPVERRQHGGVKMGLRARDAGTSLTLNSYQSLAPLPVVVPCQFAVLSVSSWSITWRMTMRPISAQKLAR
jgi:hypothetical protein